MGITIAAYRQRFARHQHLRIGGSRTTHTQREESVAWRPKHFARSKILLGRKQAVGPCAQRHPQGFCRRRLEACRRTHTQELQQYSGIWLGRRDSITLWKLHHSRRTVCGDRTQRRKHDRLPPRTLARLCRGSRAIQERRSELPPRILCQLSSQRHCHTLHSIGKG